MGERSRAGAPAGPSELLHKAASQPSEQDMVRGFKVVTLANVSDGRKELLFFFSFPFPRYGVSVAVAFKPHYTGLSSKIKCY